MGWRTSLVSWFANLFSALGGLLKTIGHWILSKLYLLLLPLIGVLKLVFDFLRAVVNLVIIKIQAMEVFKASGITFPDTIQLINSVFPVDETLVCLIALFTFALGCQLIATIRGVKQTILF